MPRKAKPIADRFWSKVDRRGPDDCWLYTGHLFAGSGYGSFCLPTGKTSGKSVGAHRLAYELSKGPIPQGLMVLHSCDVKQCCNPAHLRVGDGFDNMRDKAARGRQGKGFKKPRFTGALNNAAKLTEADVREILAHAESSRLAAIRFGVSKSNIKSIRSGNSWKHLHTKMAVSPACGADVSATTVAVTVEPT